jgi:glycolate oxidase iron-sulfur subunit
MHLVDHARERIEKTYRRPWVDRMLRLALGYVLPRPNVMRAAMAAATFVRPFAGLLPEKLSAPIKLVPKRLPSESVFDRPQVVASAATKRRRVALMTGCAQRALAPEINEATIRLLTRHGCEVVIAAGAGCCGALNHHMGQDGHPYARANILAWSREMERGGLDAIVINASGCGTTVKDYGFMFRDDPKLAKKAAAISALTRDVTELMSEIGLMAQAHPTGRRVAYHSACSLQHGQKVRLEPKQLLKDAGFAVLDPPEEHLCCGSAGTYNLLQPEIAARLRDRKITNLESLSPELIAAGNIGCITQIASGTRLPVVHTVELLDWATGGPRPPGLPA